MKNIKNKEKFYDLLISFLHEKSLLLALKDDASSSRSNFKYENKRVKVLLLKHFGDDTKWYRKIVNKNKFCFTYIYDH